jgi:hypothetical protein
VNPEFLPATWAFSGIDLLNKTGPKLNERVALKATVEPMTPLFDKATTHPGPRLCELKQISYAKLVLFPPGAVRIVFPGQASTVLQVGALSDLDDISVRIADVAANLSVLGDRLCDELRSPTFP